MHLHRWTLTKVVLAANLIGRLKFCVFQGGCTSSRLIGHFSDSIPIRPRRAITSWIWRCCRARVLDRRSIETITDSSRRSLAASPGVMISSSFCQCCTVLFFSTAPTYRVDVPAPRDPLRFIYQYQNVYQTRTDDLPLCHMPYTGNKQDKALLDQMSKVGDAVQ